MFKALFLKGRQRSVVLISLLLLAVTAFAVPAKPGLARLLTLTDGTTVNATLVGDEYAHYWLGTDGNAYQAVNDDLYQRFNPQPTKELAAKRRSAANQNRARRLNPRKVGNTSAITGQKKGLIILVNFSNVSFKTANNNALYQRIANEKNFSYNKFKGSMYDYFYDQSDGQFQLTFDVVGPVTVSKTQSYYGSNDSEGNDKHPAEMVIEALKLADSEVNYADYDWDGDGEVDQVYVVYAGKGEADGGASSTIWPHEWQLSGASYYGDGSGRQCLDNVYIDTYACGGELNGSDGTIAGIGTMCHEFSHCLGYPDFYDTDYSGGQGMGYWDLMDGGSYNDDGYRPAGFTSYERWVAGWKIPTELVYTQDISNMAALQNNGSETYIIYNKGNRNEYFLLENRQLTKWDIDLPGAGLLILHVDYDASVWAENGPNDNPSLQRMTWIPADNNYQYTMYQGTKYYSFEGMANDPFPYGSVNAFGKNTTPAAKLNNRNSDGTKYLDSSIENITQNSDGTVSFSFKGEDSVEPVDPVVGTKETIDFTVQNYGNGMAVTTVNGTNCTVTFGKGNNSNQPKYYTFGDAIRMYASNTMTVASTTKTIVGIAIAFGSGDGTNAITTDVETYSNGTWTGSASSVTFTIGGTTGQRRIQKVTVTYSESDGDDPVDPALVYYKNADGKKESELKTAMCGIIYNRTELSYDDLWSAFYTTDVRSDGKIWDMYSNVTNYDPVTSGSTYSKEGDCYNREHSFPQSWFGNNTPMYTDLHHIYPTDGFVNSKRGSLPFGETSGTGQGSYQSNDGFSKVGTCTYPGYMGKVFEPADEYKGDFARTYFYMVTCYEEKLQDWYTNYSSTEVTSVIDGTTYPGLKTWQLKMLMKWAKDDPVSEKEINRNNAVYAIQKNRNPFIDYPGLEEYVWGSMTTTAFSYDNYVQPEPSITPDPEVIPGSYVLVTDASTLAAGDKIIIAYINGDDHYVLSTTQNTNNRAATNDVTVNSDGSLIPGTASQVITLEKSGSYFLFNVGNGYLYAASSSSNTLKTAEAADNATMANITISNDAATIAFQGGYTRNTMRFNPNNGKPIFSCYSSASTTGSLPQIYRQVPAVSIVLTDDGRANSDLVSDYADQTVDVTLAGRTLYKDGTWNTICLPFDVTLADSPLAGATAKTLSDAAMSGTTVTLTFGDAVETLQAGTPYIIKWETASENIVEPTFRDVLLVDTDGQNITKADGHVKFIGYVDAFSIKEDNQTIYYLTVDTNTGNSVLKHTGTDQTLNACRAYFKFSETAAAREFVLDFGDGSEKLCGDVNDDGVVNIADVAAVLNIMAGNSTGDGDVNGDGAVNIADVAAVLNIMAGN